MAACAESGPNSWLTVTDLALYVLHVLQLAPQPTVGNGCVLAVDEPVAVG